MNNLNRIFKLLISASLCCLTAAPFQSYAQEQSAPTSASRPLLQGHVEHSESLAPVDQSFRLGNKLDVAKLKTLTPNNYWYKIPAWAAGTWKIENETNFYQYNYQDGYKTYDIDTFGARSGETWGFQKDRAGGIWEFAYGKYISLTDQDLYTSVHFVKQQEALEINDQRVVMLYRGIHCAVSKESGQIVRTEQQESIQTYTPAGGTLRKCIASIKVFDQDGHPTRLVKNLGFEIRVRPFKAWNNMDGRNMPKLFEEYLISHGMSDLVPVSMPTGTKQTGNRH